MKAFRKSTRTITDRNDKAVQTYFNEVNKHSCITPDEEARLARCIREGGRDSERAKNALIEANLRFVISVANEYKNRGLDFADLIAEGNIGLVKAAELFDETRGFKFISYAVHWIRQAIISAIEKHGSIVRLPANQYSIAREYEHRCEETMKREGRQLTMEEFAETKGIEATKMFDVINASAKSVRVDNPLADDSDTTLLDTLRSDDDTTSHLDEESLLFDLSRVMNDCLTNYEASIVRLHFGIGCKQEAFKDIAKRIGKSSERTRQIFERAIRKLRMSPHAKDLAIHLAA